MSDDDISPDDFGSSVSPSNPFLIMGGDQGKPIKEIIKELSRPFPVESVHTKIQALNKGGAVVVSYIDARNVAERLNFVCPDQWDDRYRIITVDNKLYGVECAIAIGSLSRCDVGTVAVKGQGFQGPSDPDYRMGGIKILWSDAFKRAAVKWGVGAFLYTLPSTFIPNAHLEGDGKLRKIPDETKENLKRKYAKWLKDHGESQFGEALSHGDLDDSQGDIEVSEEDADEPDA